MTRDITISDGDPPMPCSSYAPQTPTPSKECLKYLPRYAGNDDAASDAPAGVTERRLRHERPRVLNGGDSSDRAKSRAALEADCQQYVITRDPQLKVKIIEGHQWLVVVCARQMQRRGELMEDLVQIANIGLIQALDRFDSKFGVSFRTFASATILGVLRRHYRSTWRLRVPRRVQELHLLVSRGIEDLTSQLNRSPSVAELATHVGATEEDVIEALDAGANYWPLSLSRGIAGDPERVPEVVAQERELEHADQRFEVRALLNTLPERSRTVLYLSYFEERTQSEIAEMLGLSQVHISRIMRAALTQLRNAG